MKLTYRFIAGYIFYLIPISCTTLSDEPPSILSENYPSTPLLHQYEHFSSKIISLNGIWKLAEGSMDKIPDSFTHDISVPGLITQSTPAFTMVGIPSPQRQAFWYKRNFSLDHETASQVLLKIYKAKYGTSVFINGQYAANNTLIFTPTVINISPFLNKNSIENEIIIRIGAHIESLPDTVSTGGEIEKFRYIPGIYDDVELILSENILFNSVQIGTDLLKNEVLIESEIYNYGKPETVKLTAIIFDPQTNIITARGKSDPIKITTGEKQKLRMTIPVKNPIYWSPENPYLYHLKLRVGNEIYTTRFGFRSFRVDPDLTYAAYLNEKPYFFRGTNIALFRFFEDPLCTHQPWDETWVRALFQKFKSIGMNSARTCISSFPKFWYEIADEVGFALFAEYPMWYALKEGVSQSDWEKERNHPQRKYGIYPEKLTTARLVNEYSLWMKDLWNHASVIAWDAQNETWTPYTGEAIQIVRDLDLSARPWDNGWSPPVSPKDYREAHQYYESYKDISKEKKSADKIFEPFKLKDLAYKEKIPATFYLPYQHAFKLPVNRYLNQPCILNEYGYLWLNRDGAPTSLTKPYYDAVLGKDATPDQRRQHYAYMLAALTEYWRSVRTCFGVLHVFGLAHSHPEGATADNFVNIDQLEFDPYFDELVPDAFSPLGICIESWFTELNPGNPNDIPVIITNDLNELKIGTVRLSLLKGGKVIREEIRKFKIDAMDQERIWMRIEIPVENGEYDMLATLSSDQKEIKSYRKINLSSQSD